MKPLSTIFLLALAVTGLKAQTGAPAPAPVPEAAGSGTVASNPFLDLPGYLAERSAALAIRTRNLDPFGRPKDPSRTPPPPVATPDAPPDEVVEAPEIDVKAAFEQAVAGLKVVMAGDGSFSLEGGATLKQGQYFTLSSPEMRFRVQVRQATPGMILLQETAKGNFAKILIGNIPSGMSRGGAPRMPGQMPGSSNVPEIESSNVNQPTTPGVP
jgi:hypothetical protein